MSRAAKFTFFVAIDGIVFSFPRPLFVIFFVAFDIVVSFVAFAFDFFVAFEAVVF